MSGGVEELLAQTNQFLVTHLLGKMIHSHRGDELLVSNCGAVLQLDGSVAGVDLDNLALVTEASLLLGDGVGDGNPDTTGTSAGREAEGGVGTPVTGSLVQDDVGGHSLDIGGCDTLAEPGALHLVDGLVTDGWMIRWLLTLVVGTAQTLKLYGLMKRSARPPPIMRIIHSSKLVGLVLATRASRAASIMPSMHFTWSSLGSMEMLFWKG